VTSLLTKIDSPATAARRLRGHRWWPLMAATAVLIVVLALAWVVFWSPLLVVRKVDVTGQSVVSTERILRVSGLAEGTPLVQVNPGEIQRRLNGLAEITAVSVTRSWSGTVTLQITETQPLAAMRDGDRYLLVGADGAVLQSVSQRPAGLPLVDHAASTVDVDPSAQAAVAVAGALPDALLRHVDTVSATTPSAVTVLLRNGTVVTWGTPEASDVKADTVLLLLRQERQAQRYDVSVPGSPAVVR